MDNDFIETLIFNKDNYDKKEELLISILQHATEIKLTRDVVFTHDYSNDGCYYFEGKYWSKSRVIYHIGHNINLNEDLEIEDVSLFKVDFYALGYSVSINCFIMVMKDLTVKYILLFGNDIMEDAHIDRYEVEDFLANGYREITAWEVKYEDVIKLMNEDD